MTSSTTPTPTPTNDKNIDVNYGYEDNETASTKKKRIPSVHGLRVSSLDETLRKSVAKMNLDKKDDGKLDEEEIVQAVNSLVATIRINRTLKVAITVCLCVFAMLLVGCVFGATIAIARLTKQTDIDSITGIMYSKESNSDHSHQTTMKTEDVVIYSDITNMMDMTNEELKTLKEVLLPNDDVKFQINGYARGRDNTEIGLFVQGGTIIYDNEGLASATGDAKILLDLAYGSVQEGQEEDGSGLRRRYLATGCGGSKKGTSSGASNTSRG